MSPRRRRPGEKLRSLYLWHRYAGLAAALLVLWLAATGLLLNHSDDLALAQRYVKSDWLLAAYGIRASSDEIYGHRVGGHWLAQSGNLIYLDAQQLGEGTLVGAAEAEFGLVVAFADRLQLHAEDGGLIETVASPAAMPLISIAPVADGFVVSTAQHAFLADTNVTRFVPVDKPVLAVAPPEPLPDDLAQRLADNVRYNALSWERVLLDLHAGRLFGSGGVWLADLAGILLLLLAVTGVIVWLQRAAARGRRER